MTAPTATPAAATSPVTIRRRLPPPEVRLALSLASVLAVVGVAVGGSSFTPEAAGGATYRLDGPVASVFVQILSRNAAAVGLLSSGYVTFGLSSVVAILLTSTWIGATLQAIGSTGGLTHLSMATIVYIAMEFGGLLVAGGAGLLGPACWAKSALNPDRPERARPTRHFFRLVGVAGVLIVCAAALETAVVVVHL